MLVRKLIVLCGLACGAGCNLISGVDDLHLAGHERDAGLPEKKGDASLSLDGTSGNAPETSISDRRSVGSDASDASARFDGSGVGDAAQGVPGIDSVVGGGLMKSSGHRLLITVGEAPEGNGVQSSTGHRLVGGLVGATQQ
jgi:hypothetical protein